MQGNIQGLISGGKPERRGDSPWHVAIYDVSNEPLLICGGTIITSKIIVSGQLKNCICCSEISFQDFLNKNIEIFSAAHCFYNFPAKKLYNTRNFEVIVSKYSRDYKVKDNSETKLYKVSVK